MASYYITQIRSVQPEGPYLLGGYSLGGLIAYEMAQQLSERSHEVGMVALLDTYPNGPNSHPKSLLRLLVPTREHLLQDWPEIIKKIFLNVQQTWTVPRELKNVFRSNKSASDRYVLRPYAGKVILFRAVDKSSRIGDDAYARWDELVDGLETHLIPGDHRGILFDPQVQRLAESLKARIDQAVTEYEHC
jgi:thioesterase domain-containing protein